MVGDLEVLTNAPRATSIHAVRDTELAKIPAGLLHLVKHRYAEVATHLMRIMSERLLRLVQGTPKDPHARNLSTVSDRLL